MTTSEQITHAFDQDAPSHPKTFLSHTVYVLMLPQVWGFIKTESATHSSQPISLLREKPAPHNLGRLEFAFQVDVLRLQGKQFWIRIQRHFAVPTQVEADGML